jgi:hypothetical protein
LGDDAGVGGVALLAAVGEAAPPRLAGGGAIYIAVGSGAIRRPLAVRDTQGRRGQRANTNSPFAESVTAAE